MLSFIIPAHNEALYLPATLTALREAATAIGVTHEIVVVDDASTDGTGEIAIAHGAHLLRVEHRHIAATRNAGARHAKGHILFFIDADTRINETLLRAALDELADGTIGGGATVRLDGRPTWHERWLTASFVWLLRQCRYAPGCFIFCTRNVYDAVDGFDESFYAAEDIAISRKFSRIGRFVILRHTVVTSDRKLRTFTLRDHFVLLLRMVLSRGKVLQSREHLKLWYEDRKSEG